MSTTGYIPTGSTAPRPTALYVLEGGDQGRKINEEDAELVKSGALGTAQMPDWLSDEAKAEWQRLAPKLEMLGILTAHDTMSFAAYCQAYAKWKEAEIFMNENGTIVRTGNGYWQQVPQVSISMQNLKIMMALSARFGLTPADRARLDLEVLPNQNDPLDKLLAED